MPDAAQQERSSTESTGGRASLVVTNVIKLGGVVVVIHEVFAEPHIRSAAIAVSALMMAGAQSLETFLTSFFGGKR